MNASIDRPERGVESINLTCAVNFQSAARPHVFAQMTKDFWRTCDAIVLQKSTTTIRSDLTINL